MDMTYHNHFLINSSEPASATLDTHFGFSSSEIDPSVQAPPNPSCNGYLNLLYYHPAGINMSTTATPEEASPVFEAIREMMFRMAAMQPVLEQVHPDTVRPKKRKNIRISSQPQTVAARQRRERISERIGILRMMVPGGTKMDTASMLDETIRYVKFLKQEVKSLQEMASSCGFNGDVMWPGLKGAGSGSVDSGSCPYNTTDNSSCSSDNSWEFSRTFGSQSYSHIGEGN